MCNLTVHLICPNIYIKNRVKYLDPYYGSKWEQKLYTNSMNPPFVALTLLFVYVMYLNEKQNIPFCINQGYMSFDCTSNMSKHIYRKCK